MSPFWFNLNVSFPLFKDGILVHELIEDQSRYNYKNLENYEDLVSDQFRSFFNGFGVKVFMVELFHSRPYNNTAPHIDISRGDAVKINWVFGGVGSTMNWYEELPWSKTTDMLSDASTNVILVNRQHVKLLERYSLQGPTVVQTGIPHNITTYKDQRYCVNVSITENKGRPTMSRAKEIFSSVIGL